MQIEFIYILDQLVGGWAIKAIKETIVGDFAHNNCDVCLICHSQLSHDGSAESREFVCHYRELVPL